MMPGLKPDTGLETATLRADQIAEAIDYARMANRVLAKDTIKGRVVEDARREQLDLVTYAIGLKLWECNRDFDRDAFHKAAAVGQ